jgi:hypothetical protein
LALEIADRDGLRLEPGIEKAIDRGPVFLLWVISPGALSEQILTELGMAMRERGSPVSVGFITGSTMESARRLYLRKFSYSSRHAAIDALGETITQYSGDTVAVMPLDSTSLQRVLQNTSYLCYTGHGGGGYWRLSEEMIFTFDDIEPIPPLVVTSGACQTFRPWEGPSIAMTFTDRGAAAYAGFLFSPAPYYHFGFPEGFPLRFTHPDFPIGIVTALQNRGGEKSYARFPFYFLLGDPRICFQQEEPHRLIEDQTSGDERLLRFAGAPKGFIPVRIEGGAAYSFIEIEGVAAAGGSDPFYNSRLQFLDLCKDRYLLFDHAGGDFTIRLRNTEPFLWTSKDALIDAFDHAFVYLPTTGGILFLLIVTASVLFVAVVHTVRSGGRARGFFAALTAGICVASWRGLYAIFRVGRASIVSTPVGFESRFVLASFLLAGCGAFLYFNVRSRLWRMGAVLVSPSSASRSFCS